MISEEIKKKIDLFLEDLNALMEGGKTEGDFSDLYARHPEVRVCIRRAMWHLRKRNK